MRFTFSSDSLVHLRHRRTGRFWRAGVRSRNEYMDDAGEHTPPRLGLAAVTGRDGHIYAIGGNDVATVEGYDPASDTWTTRASMPTARGGLAAVAGPDGRIYAIG